MFYGIFYALGKQQHSINVLLMKILTVENMKSYNTRSSGGNVINKNVINKNKVKGLESDCVSRGGMEIILSDMIRENGFQEIKPHLHRKKKLSRLTDE